MSFQDITQLDRSRPYGTIKSLDPAKQKVFFVQDDIEYDAAGCACNAKQVQDHYDKVAAQAQADADAAAEAAKAAKANAAAMIKEAKERAKAAPAAVKAAQKAAGA